MMTAASYEGRQTLVIAENVLQVAPKLTKTKPLVNFAKYFVERQFWK